MDFGWWIVGTGSLARATTGVSRVEDPPPWLSEGYPVRNPSQKLPGWDALQTVRGYATPQRPEVPGGSKGP
jgi:hypothetical protein